jgi:protein-tyrosine phosphatase
MNRMLCGALLLLLPLTLLAEVPSSTTATGAQAEQRLLMSYRRLLPLEGGSNFRDLGGYSTRDGRTVKRGLLFRSGAMTGLTASDMDYLGQFDFQGGGGPPVLGGGGAFPQPLGRVTGDRLPAP